VGDSGVRAGDRIRVAVSGAHGRMGSLTCRAIAADEGLVLRAVVDPVFGEAGAQAGMFADGGAGEAQRFSTLADALKVGGIQVVVDFSIPAAVRENVLTCLRHKVAVVVGTTGLREVDLAEIREHAESEGTPVLVVPNFAMSAVLMMEFARRAAQHFSACEIVELHHDGKLDIPSGTSLLTRAGIERTWGERGLEKEVPIHSVRLPGLVAHQEVMFGAAGEVLTIRQDSLSRDSFMPGVVLAVKKVRSLQGLAVGLENIL